MLIAFWGVGKVPHDVYTVCYFCISYEKCSLMINVYSDGSPAHYL